MEPRGWALDRSAKSLALASTFVTQENDRERRQLREAERDHIVRPDFDKMGFGIANLKLVKWNMGRAPIPKCQTRASKKAQVDVASFEPNRRRLYDVFLTRSSMMRSL